ncbi:hypothetical protein IFM89_025606 [Coptis chinensis]|uniref:non-specific serine/threonine protein kinase n=1 Tax=Coptis chinensis TaxID=261450 RepID=A0A835M9I5_9MAGN|nr:hypothetical protein IFM89_025606 [Coptis chinensis]
MVFLKFMCILFLQYAAFSACELVSKGHNQNSLVADKAALLAFKRTITPERQSALVNWHETSDVCNFTGVLCDQWQYRVSELVLNNTNIGGLLSPFIANLTGLRVLDLSQNNFFGPIPTEFTHLRFLWFLKLDGNYLHGQIPVSLSLLWRLRYVHLGSNDLNGTIPASIFTNCSLLQYVDFSNNSLTGKIPAEVGNPQELWSLNLYINNLSGKLPISLSNLSELYSLDVENNYLFGELPSEVVVKLKFLKYLHLSYNDMVSYANNTNLEPFFTSLSNCTDLVELELAGMGLGGRLSSIIGQLPSTLSAIHLEDNRIFGLISPNVGNNSNLTLLNLSSNLLNGTIPFEIAQLKRLQQIILSNNFFSGEIPDTLGKLRSIGLLDLSRNRLTGQIPASLGDLSLLSYLFLNNNSLSGAIPPSLGRCRDLHKLDLSHNGLTGIIPPEISGLAEIRIFLNLSHNLLEGPLPYEISKMESVQEIDLSSNNFTGNIFPQIAGCIAINLLNLSHNSFQGPLPESLGKLRNLESLDVSNNSLSGLIPLSLGDCPSLTSLDLSFNNFHGPIPTGGVFNLVTNLTFLGNADDLCGSVPGIHICWGRKHSLHSRKFVIEVSVGISASLFLFTIFCWIGHRYIKGIISTEKDELFSTSAPELKFNFPRITYKELSEATGGFDEGKLIGSGSFGKVYQGVLRDGTAVAIKVLQLHTGNSTKSFTRECQVLKRIRHRNLMRIITACSLPDFKALVLPYMSNGSLDSHLYPRPGTERVIDSSLMVAARDQAPEVMKMWETAIAELLELGLFCTQEAPSSRPTMLDAADDLDRLKRYLNGDTTATFASSLGISSSTLDDD